jgi:prepilin-type processing-associated H-X9-DG protein
LSQTSAARPLVIAHRGGGGLIPENTLEAFEYSARMGVDVLELDVHSTSDGALVVMHDRSVDRTTDGHGRINEMTLGEIKKLDAGYSFSPDDGQTFPFRGKGITVPTLEEIFAAFPETTFNIEPKQAAPSIIKPLCSLLRERKMADKTIVGSFRQAVIDEFRGECSEVATSASPSEVSKPSEMMAIGDGFHGNGEEIFTGQDVLWRHNSYTGFRDGTPAKARHLAKASVVFCDGHVESPTLKSLFEDLTDPALIRWNRDNLPHRELLEP